MHLAEPMPRDDTSVLICDLDGTILRANSFPLWILYLIAGPLPELGLRRRAVLSLRAQTLLLRRKLGRIDHEQLMRGIQEAWHDAGGTDAAADRVPRLLRRLVRPMFEPLLHQIAVGRIDAVLATAAAGEYANVLGYQLGFRHVLTTSCRLARHGALNVGRQKLLNVLEFLSDQGWAERPLVLLTDHLDDLPLMRHCDAVGWFGSASAMARSVALAGGTKFIDCRGLDADTLSAAVVELSAYARTSALLANTSA
jgi:phosphoserine phosphatase